MKAIISLLSILFAATAVFCAASWSINPSGNLDIVGTIASLLCIANWLVYRAAFVWRAKTK